MIILGLTGSIGMGKSTVSKMFYDAGVPVWDADAQVHQGYEGGGEAEERVYEKILAEFPEACTKAVIDRKIIADMVFADRTRLDILNDIFGHYIEVELGKFIADQRWNKKSELIVLDVPLLFEGGNTIRHCDYVAVVHCSPEEQKARVLRRPGMTEDRLRAVMRNQMPSEEKMKSADILIDTSLPIVEVRSRVANIIANIGDAEWVLDAR